jgi:hypothetical protein
MSSPAANGRTRENKTGGQQRSHILPVLLVQWQWSHVVKNTLSSQKGQFLYILKASLPSTIVREGKLLYPPDVRRRADTLSCFDLRRPISCELRNSFFHMKIVTSLPRSVAISRIM